MKSFPPLHRWKLHHFLAMVGLLLFLVISWSFEEEVGEVLTQQESPTTAVAPTPPPDMETSTSSSSLYPVVSVTDGDTIKVAIDGETKTVRLVNINTPETVDPRRPVECMGKEASEAMTQLVSNQRVFLEIDETQAASDRYNRLLRFVFLEDGTDVGLELITQGYAETSPYGSSPHTYLAVYEAAQQEAQENRVGLWNPQNCQ